MDHLLAALLYLSGGLLPVYSFNIETENPVSFSQDQHSQFGHTVTQFNDKIRKWMLVGAPLLEDASQHRTGAVYKCRYEERTCNKLNLQMPNGTENMGLSLAASDASTPRVLACAPRLSYACHTNTYINGYCDVLGASFGPWERIPPKPLACPKALIDIAFLIDGSGSVSNTDFERMKDFIRAIMKRFSSRETQIALAQFSSNARTEFTFHQYNQDPNKENLVNIIRQIHGGTDTPNGINYVVDTIFTLSAGARNEAKRILITITDGESYNTNFGDAIYAADQKKIQRYAIGVGNAFNNNRAKKELEKIASKSENVFQVSNFQALDSIQKELKEKIFAIEGTEGSGAISSFELEMAQEGFSALVASEAFVLGAVGAYDWSGGLVEFRPGRRTFINVTTSHTDMKNAYLGYTVKEIKKGNTAYYITGAPRYRHKGEVLVFPQSGNRNWREKIVGKQIGSYFGSELCPVDLNRDGQTDLLLVGAPMYHTREKGGIVYMYKVLNGGHLQELNTLSGEQGEQLGRFGAAIAEVADLNGDRITDVAIGAPLEDGHRGTVYIYHGTPSRINPTHSQLIRSAEIESGLKYFGQSIHGSMDVSGDGLTDIAVGALGKVFVFRSRPVLDVSITMQFVPNKILLKDVDCSQSSAGGPRVDANICFAIRQLTSNVPGSPSVNLTYELKLDPGRKIQRAELVTEPTGSFILSNTQCVKPKIHVESCIQDYYNPILLQVTFTGVGQRTRNIPAPILKQGNNRISTGKLSFEQECGADNICTDHLQVQFVVVGPQFLVVGSHSTLTVKVTLQNTGENSYFTVVTFRVPTGLSYRISSIIRSSRRSHIVCDDAKNSRFSSVGVVPCRVNHPIFRTGSTLIFETTFDVAANVDWKPTADISVNATSDNEQRTLTDSFVQKRFGVKYEVNVIIKGIASTQYVNFTTDKADEKPVLHTYKVENVGLQALPVQITFQVRVKVGPGLTWDQLQVNSTNVSELGMNICLNVPRSLSPFNSVSLTLSLSLSPSPSLHPPLSVSLTVFILKPE
ncbi:integrin alpha-X-like [Heterodontus francisci]|uniref:integrin alpha-X-like n=1 Tax=Heterodontus francisci TaxID=7792 RepID=UPI00355B6D3D